MSNVRHRNSFNSSTGKSNESSFSNVKGFGHLPESVLLRIFSYFNEDELKRNIIPVCQQWRNVAEHPTLWKVIKFQGKTLETSYICDKIWQFNKVKTIIIKNIVAPIVVLRQICRCSEYLKNLTLRSCPQIPEDSLRHLIFSCKHLESLDLKGTPFRSLIFYEELASVRNLSSINISDNPHLTTSNITTIILNCRSLTAFHLSTFKPLNKINMNDADCYFLLSHTVLRLTSLTLDCSTLSSYSFASILRCKNLRYLCLNYAYNFDGRDFQDLWKTIKNLTSLKIRFAHQVNDLAVKSLFEKGKKFMAKLEVLDFTGCSLIGDVGMTAVTQCCVNLKSLVLRGCKNVVSLQSILKNCPLIEVLNIAFCDNINFNDVSIAKNLKCLFISDNKLSKLFANSVKKVDTNIAVRICDSEYNKIVLYPYFVVFKTECLI